VARKSCVEFGWLAGIPDRVSTEQHFHVKFEADRRKAPVPAPRGEGTIAGSQTVFHRPANSGNYALICHLELSRVGVNDVTRECALTAESAALRRRAAVQALIATLVRLAGAQCNTQTPHLIECSGVVTLSRSYLPAPMLSPLSETYREEIASIVETMNRLTPEMIEAHRFETLAQGLERLERAAAGV
jgi:CRISPR-associated protein Cst2